MVDLASPGTAVLTGGPLSQVPGVSAAYAGQSIAPALLRQPIPPGILRNDLEGANGTQITTSNTGGLNQFDTVTVVGAGATCAFDTTQAHSGATSLTCVYPAAIAATHLLGYTTSLTPAASQVFFRAYVWVDANPSVAVRVATYFGSGTQRFSLRILATGVVAVYAIATNTLQTVAVIPKSQWVRLEVDCTSMGATTANLALRTFSGANLETATPDETLTSTGSTIGGSIDELRIVDNAAVTQTTAFTSRIDDIAHSDVSSPGPTAAAVATVVARRIGKYVSAI